MLLMHRNVKVCKIDTNSAEVKILDADEMPLSLFLEESNSFSDRVNNLLNFYHWGASRVLSLDREHAKAILNSCALSQATTDKEKCLVAMKYRCLSLQDCYWTKEEEETICWDDVSLFRNSLSNAFVDVALTGRNMSVENTMLVAADCSTSGVFPKAWVRDKDGFWLLKGDKKDSVRKEVEASKILQKLGLDVLNYDYSKWEGQAVARCRCFTSESCEFVPIEEYVPNYNLLPRDDAYYTMILADYLVGNADRHWGNWGYLVSEGRQLTLAPIMDFNHAFEASIENICKPELCYDERKTELEAAVQAYKYVKFRKVDLSEFHYGEFVLERIKHLKRHLDDKNL